MAARHRKHNDSDICKVVSISLRQPDLAALDALQAAYTGRDGKRPSRSMIIAALVKEATVRGMSWGLSSL